MRRLDFPHELVSFFLRHLSAADHVLQQIARALENESGEACRSSDYVFHGCGHFATGLETDLVGLRRHLSDGIFHVCAAMPGASLRRNRRRRNSADDGRRWRDSGNRWLFSICHL
jgi:hypothetical protein